MGSFLNVVIYRLPREKVAGFPAVGVPRPAIRRSVFYNNIPLFLLADPSREMPRTARPRSPAAIFIVETCHRIAFLGGLYLLFFLVSRFARPASRAAFRWSGSSRGGGWLFLPGCHDARSDPSWRLQRSIWSCLSSPLEMCWFVTIIGLICASVAEFVVAPGRFDSVFPVFSMAPKMAAITLGGGYRGWFLSLIGLWTGIIKPSYEMAEQEENGRYRQCQAVQRRS